MNFKITPLLVFEPEIISTLISRTNSQNWKMTSLSFVFLLTSVVGLRADTGGLPD
jgi:hypothetical protein